LLLTKAFTTLQSILNLCLFVTLSVSNSVANDLPSIGLSVPDSVIAKEKRLGQTWLRLYRQHVPVSFDPLLVDYTENLLSNLAKYNPAAGDEFSLVITKNKSINAFAVPGGIIGVHTGLFQYALTEDQFASVLAHELAHLSQRHYARRVEKQKSQSIINMAGLLAGLVLAAKGDGDAGIAAIQATQAGIIDQQLRFSRLFEQEADRIGMRTLLQAGFDPHSMVDMFEQMQRASRFSSKPPEFLLTHPVTAKRIADAENRSRDIPKSHAPSSVNYDIMRSRVLFMHEETPQQAVMRFQSELKGFSPSEVGSRYGLVLALIASKEFEDAKTNLAPLLKRYPLKPAFIIAQSDIESETDGHESAIEIIKSALKKEPDDYALTIQYTQLLASNNQYNLASQILDKLRKKRPQDPFVLYHLAEIAGLANDILTLHKARAEYFILYGDFESAKNQLENIIRKFGNDEAEKKYAQKRLRDIKEIQKNSKL
jgi:predicted Zn-dependent protease